MVSTPHIAPSEALSSRKAPFLFYFEFLKIVVTILGHLNFHMHLKKFFLEREVIKFIYFNGGTAD